MSLPTFDHSQEKSNLNPVAGTTSPVLFLVFNRPDVTGAVFNEIRKAEPPRLYVAADGPRSSRAKEAELCEQVRSVATAVDWNCELHTLFRESNLGCKLAIGTAIDWFFSNEEQGIILEDDCLPHPDFFTFCDQMLRVYSNDNRVWVVTGDNFQNGHARGAGSYYFSKYNHCWGWASWRRAWQHYDADLSFWPLWLGSADWREKMPDRTERKYWNKIFNQVHRGKVDTWDYPWTGSVWYNGGLTVTPNVNLVSNIGFGENSTHTSDASSNLAALPTRAIGTLRHPGAVEQDVYADRYVFRNAVQGRRGRYALRLLGRVQRVTRQLFSRLV